MKLVRYGDAGQERPGLIDLEGRLRDLSQHLAELDAAALAPASLTRLRALEAEALPLVSAQVRLGPPLIGVGKIICIGLNYTDHAQEAGLPLPAEPVLFLKASSAITGPNDPICLPAGSEKTDWELELAVIIGSQAKSVSPDGAAACIAGYCIGLDMSERYWQLERGGQWTKGKSFDTFAPIGPWCVTPDEFPAALDLGMQLSVNGTLAQHSATGKMAFDVPHLISYVSHVMTLQPGDIIFTGTPAGVGMGRQPPSYLRPGDLLAATIEGLGAQLHTAVATD